MTRACIVVIGLFLALPASAPRAQQPGPEADGTPAAVSAPEVAGPQVQTPTGLPERAPQARTMRAYWHVFIAFGATWLLLFGYALSVGRRFGQLESEVRRLASSETPK